MESINEFSERLIKCIESHPGISSKEKAEILSTGLKYLVGDILKLIKNINDTSLPGSDRTNRIIEIEAKYNIPKTHIL